MKSEIKNCAIYTRKSTEEGLDQEFNSLDAQRESCEAYILSQKSDGWKTVKTKYDDGGYSGGNIERPGLKKLIEDIKAGKIQTVVVYKIDRLTRSLMDFSKLVEVFDEYGVTFVSVTQSFNTTTSMGRLTLNVLLSFAQFERDVTGERIRDKIAASKKKGMWMGGFPPLGYHRVDKKLIPHPKAMKTFQFIFNEYLKCGSIRILKDITCNKNIKTPVRTSKRGNTYGGADLSRGHLYQILRNPLYAGKIKHKDEIYDGLHDAIIDKDIYESVQTLLNQQSIIRSNKSVNSEQLLKGILHDIDGTIYSPTYTSKGKKRYHYYISQNLIQYRDHPKGVLARIPSQEIDTTVINGLKSYISNDQNLMTLYPSSDSQTLKWIAKQDININNDALRCLLKKVILSYDQITLKIDVIELQKYLMRTLNVAMQQPSEKEINISIDFKTKRIDNGTIIVEDQNNNKDILDIPTEQLTRIVKGIVWRDEHFDGSSLRDIAKRHNHSENHINRCIQDSFEFLTA